MLKFIPTLILGFTLIPLAEATCPNGKSYPVTLTFDDGPKSGLTPKVLDILKEENIKATFFVLGENFPGGKSNPANKEAYALLDREKAEGHYIGSHTYHHLEHSKMTTEQMRTNINKSNPLLKDYMSPILRLPYGDGSFRSSNPAKQAKNDQVMKTIKDAGLKHVGWDIDTNDWDAKKRSILVSSMLKQICSTHGGIILFHDVQANTVKHLKEWIGIIRKEGHTIVGLEQFVSGLPKPQVAPVCDETQIPTKTVNELDSTVNQVMEKIPEEKTE